MTQLAIEMSGYLAAAALLGLILGYLFWGWGRRRAIADARAEGALSVRTSLHGDPGLTAQLNAATADRDRLQAEIERLNARLRALREQPGAAPAEPSGAKDDAGAGARRPQEAAPPQTSASRPDISRADISRADSPLPEARQPAAGGPASAGRPAVPADADGGRSAEMPGPAEGALRRQAIPAAGEARPADEQPRADAPASLAPGRPAPPATLLREWPGEADDLTRINGVGAAMERILNENGIWLYRQIAGFSSTDIAWLTRAVGALPGRLQSDGWVEQARNLQREKDGPPRDEAAG